MTSQVEDRRRLPIFIHSTIDDMTDITPNAMRVYMHLARRAGKSGFAFPSYQSIGDHCFSSVSDNHATRRSMARKAIDDLIAHKLIEKRARVTGDGDSDSNGYVLLDTGMPIGTPMPIDTPMPNKHTGVLNRHTGVPIGTKDTPIEGSPIEGSPIEELSIDNTPIGVAPMAQISFTSALTPSNGNGKHEKPKRERSDKQKELDDWVNALAVALEFDAKIPGAYAKWTKIGKGYAAAGYVPADVLAWKETAWPLSWQYERGYKPSKNVLDDGLPEIRRKREKLEAKSRPTPPKALGVVNIDGKRMQILKHADGREELKEIVEVTA